MGKIHLCLELAFDEASDAPSFVPGGHSQSAAQDTWDETPSFWQSDVPETSAITAIDEAVMVTDALSGPCR